MTKFLTGIITYLEDTYLPMRFEFCHFAIKNYRNYGIRVTSRTEGAHGQLKAHLKNGVGDLQKLHQAVIRTSKRLHEKYNILLQKELESTPQNIKKYAVLKDLRYQVSHYALGQLGKQADKALEALKAGKDLPPCTGAFLNQCGLPCAHRITTILHSNSVLSLNDIDPHWRLPRDEVCLSAPFIYFILTITSATRPSITRA